MNDDCVFDDSMTDQLPASSIRHLLVFLLLPLSALFFGNLILQSGQRQMAVVNVNNLVRYQL